MQTLLRFFFFCERFLNVSLRSNKTLWERSFGRGRTTRRILWTCLTAAKQLSSYLTREDKSFTLLVCWTTQLTQYVPIHNKNPVISWQCLKICTSSMPTCLEPNCNIGHKWVQPGEWGLSQLHWYWHFEEDWLTDVFSHPSHCTGYSSFLCRVIYVESYL